MNSAAVVTGTGPKETNSVDADKVIRDLEKNCHDCGRVLDDPTQCWEMNCEPKVYSYRGVLKRVCHYCYVTNGQCLDQRRKARNAQTHS
jgi:hypothetical protein